MSLKPHAKSLRAADGMELVSRFAKHGGTIRASDGFGMPMNKVPMSAQDQGAFNNLQDSPASLAPDAAAKKAPEPGLGPKASSIAMLNSFQPMAMPTISLRHGGGDDAYADGHGGQVQGNPQAGDVKPAWYTGGEFVASNAMLRKEPGLREHLRGLREEVLAEKGMTPEQADAKALGGGGLRAAGGFGGFPQGFPSADDLELKRAYEVPAVIQPQGSPQQAARPAAPARLQSGQPRIADMHGYIDAPSGFIPDPVAIGNNPSLPVNSAPLAPDRPSVEQMNRPGVDARANAASERAAYASERARIENPRSMTKAELFSRGDGSTRGPNPMRFAPPAPQTAANAAANAAASAAPALAPAPASAPAPTNPTFGSSKYAAVRGAGVGLDALGAGAKSAYGAVKAVGPGLAAGAAGYYAADQARSIGAPVEGARGGYAPPAAADQIPTDGYSPAPEKQAYNYFTDNETGRNLGNIANAVAPLGGIVGAGLRTLPVAGKVATRLTVGADMADAATAGAAGAVREGRAETTAPGRTPTTQTASGAQTDYSATSARSDQRNLRNGVEQPQDLVTGPDGRQYINAPVSSDDHLKSDTMIRQAFERPHKTGGEFSMDKGIRKLRGDPNAMALANMGWAKRGAGVMASRDENGGLVLSNSTGPEKMQYTGRDGKPTSQYENTAQYAQGMEVARKDRELLATMQKDRALREGGGADKYAGLPHKTAAAMRVADAEAASRLANTQATNANQLLIERENRASSERVSMMPFKIDQQNRDNLAALLHGGADGKGNGAMDTKGARAMMLQNGMPIDAIDKVIKGDNDAKAAEETLESGKAKRMSEQFKGDFGHLPKEEREYAEGLAAQTLAKFASGKIVGAGKGQDMKHEALLYTRAILGMQAKTKLRNAGWFNAIAGEDSMPTSIDGTVTPERVGGLRGALTGHGLKSGDILLGDQELPSDIGDDVVSYLRRYNKATTAARTKAK